MAASMRRFSRNFSNLSFKDLQYFSKGHYLSENIRKNVIRFSRTIICRQYKAPWLFMFPLVPTVEAIGFGWSKSKDLEAEKNSKFEGIISTADRLYESNKVLELYDYLVQYKDNGNAEVLWRLARATCDKGKFSRDKEQRKQCMFEACEYSKKALALDGNSSPCNKWYAILLDYTAEYEGTKVRILNSYKVKEHFLKAIKLNPKDATSIYSLGYWCFVFADLPWYQRKLASTLLATPPSSTYEEALEYFLLAENVEPNFYSMNLLMLGKTYDRLGNKDAAKEYLIKARDYPVQTTDDEQAHKEAIELLKNLGVREPPKITTSRG
ncbi:hypothetical protein SNE40_007169 [Patella caerulea]|uniref:Regulator of microtubule dynamics protein 1 n=1 Tax=Patella caerulea TaxID=87958 RepID=A0AAN8JTA6_PATCE